MNSKDITTIEEFKQYLILKGIKPKTIYEYKYTVTDLFKFAEEKALSFMAFKVTDAQEFQGWVIEKGRLKQGGYSDGTVAHYIDMAVAYFDFLKTKKIVYENPFRMIRRIKEKRKIPVGVLKENQMAMLLNAIRNFSKEEDLRTQKSYYRMQVLMELMYSTGMRISEAANIVLSDIDFSQGIIHLRDTKDKKERYIFLNSYTKEVLQIYIDSMRQVIADPRWDKTKLFGCSIRTLKSHLNKALKIFCQKIGLPVISSKGFRHAFGYHLLRAGCDIRYIQELLGHSKLVSTEKYTKVDKENLRDVIDLFHPRKWNR